MAGDVDPGLGAPDACLPRTLGAGDVAACVEFGRVLAEVPHVAASVLAVPVGSAFLEPTPHVKAVVNCDAADAFDRLGLAGDRDNVASPLTVFHAGVDPAGAPGEREPRVVDVRAEA